MQTATVNTKKNIMLVIDLAVLIGIAWFAFYVNDGIEIKGLYMDDLYMWSCYGEQSLVEFAFPIGTSTRFRPVYWLATYLQMAIVGTHVERFVTFNIVANILVAYELWYMARRLSRGLHIVPAAVSTAFLASRFAYYQISQALGLMETMALSMAVLVLYLLYTFILGLPGTRSGGKWRYYAALIVYFLLSFTHERYIVIGAMFMAAMCMRTALAGKGCRQARIKSDIAKWIAPAAVLAVIIAIRTFAIGHALPAGTGGTEVSETFSIREALSYAVAQVYYIFGLNAGPEYLNGIPWSETPENVKLLVKISVLMIGVVVLLYMLKVFGEIAGCLRHGKESGGDSAEMPLAASALPAADKTPVTEKLPAMETPAGLTADICTCAMFIIFIALCIGCSSVTIRLEMRWIYVSYAASLLLASYMTGRLCEPLNKGIVINRKDIDSWEDAAAAGNMADNAAGAANVRSTAVRLVATAAFIMYTLLSIGTNIFYRGYFDRLYYWPNQLRMNSLAEETIEKYGLDGILGKNIYILGNSYEMTDFYAETFFKPYDPDKKAEGTKIIFIENESKVPADEVREGNALVLTEVPEENAYRDITGQFA